MASRGRPAGTTQAGGGPEDGQAGGGASADRISRPDSIAKNTAFSFATQLTTASLTALLTVVLVRVLDPDGYGLFALAMSVGALALTASDLGISASTLRFVAEVQDRRTQVGPLVVDGLKLKIIVAGTVCVLLWVFAGPLAAAYGEPRLEWPLRGVALATFGQSLMLMQGGVFISLGRTSVNLRMVAIESVLEVSASIAFVLLATGATAASFGRAFGYIVGSAIALVLTLRLLGNPPLRLNRLPRRETVKRVTGYAGALLVVNIAYTLTSSLNTLILGAIAGSAANGIYSSVARLGALVGYPGVSLANGITPQLARRPGREPKVGALGAGLRVLISLQCLLLAPAVVWAEPITALVLGSGYEESADVLRAIAPYLFFLGFAPLVSGSVNYLGEAKRRVPLALVTVAITVGCALVLTPRLGVVGAAITSDISLGFYTLGHLWLCRRLLRLPLLPLAWALACGLTAAAAMALVLTVVGTERDLSLLQWVAGIVLGLAAYVGILVFTREVTLREIARLGAVLRTKFGGRASRRPAPAPAAAGAPVAAAVAVAAPAVTQPALATAAVGAPGATLAPRVVHEIGWRGARDGGTFELRPLDEEDDLPAEATSTTLDWRWGIPPAPIPDARAAHGDLVDRLLHDGWEPHGWGESWYATRLVPPARSGDG